MFSALDQLLATLVLGQIVFSQFVDVWLAKFTGNNKATVRLRKAQKAIHDCIARLREIFDIFDPDGDGSITEEELVCVLNTLSSREQVGSCQLGLI